MEIDALKTEDVEHPLLGRYNQEDFLAELAKNLLKVLKPVIGTRPEMAHTCPDDDDEADDDDDKERNENLDEDGYCHCRRFFDKDKFTSLTSAFVAELWREFKRPL